MTQDELDAGVARVTGESVRRIRRQGFSLVGPIQSQFDSDLDMPPQVIDWDDVYRPQPMPFRPRRAKRLAVAGLHS
jgi:hypothetical protein